MGRGNKVGVKGSSWRRIGQREKHSDESDEEYKVGEDEEGDESDECCSIDSDESEEEEELERVARSRTTHNTSSVRKGNDKKMPRKRRRISYTEMDDDEDEDDAEFVSLGRKENPMKKPQEKKRVSYIKEDEVEEGDDEDDSGFMSSGRKGNQIKKPRQNRISFTEGDDDDEAAEEDEDYSEFISARKENQAKRHWEKKMVPYIEEDDEDDAEFMSLSRKGNQITGPRENRSASYREKDDDDDEEEDKDDEEFTLTLSDFIDDDDEELKMMKSEKVSSYPLHKRGFWRGQKKNRKSKVLKKATRPKPRNRRLKGKISSSRDRQVTKKDLKVEQRSKKLSSQRKRRVSAESDSDFVSSVSSDHEYTISEEEREQMREAKVYCANLRAKLSSSSRRQEEPICEQRGPPVRKGKEKVEDVKDEVGKQVCGICLSEEGKRTVRGALNCCRHHFCFSCIMEWSKVESRCPLCKQRFATITKSGRSDTGFDLRAVVITVPERDQIYQPSEEEVRGYLDPYESVICTECHQGGEDAFMLLCDICDSPAHTFCVGLGREVPEDNWYCDGCRKTVFSSLNSERPTPRLSTNASDLSSPVAGGFDLNEVYVPEMPSTQETHILPEPRLPTGDFMPAGTAATTLRDRRRIHRQIHHRFLNNNRWSDLIARSSGPSASSTGIRLFGSHLDQARDSIPRQITMPERATHPHVVVEGTEDHVMPSMRDANLISPSMNQFIVQVQNSTFTSFDGSMQAELGGSGMAFDSSFGHAPLHPCTNRSSIGSDASPSPYPCREAMGSSRTQQGSLHTPY